MGFERAQLQLKEMAESKRGDSAFGQPLQENLEKAQEKLQQYQQIQEKNGFNDRKMELLADSENPYRLAKFSEQDRLELSEMLQEIKQKNTEKTEVSSPSLSGEQMKMRQEQDAQKLAAVRESLGGKGEPFTAGQLQESVAQTEEREDGGKDTFVEDALKAMNGYSRGGSVEIANARYGLEKLAKNLDEAGEHERAVAYRENIDDVVTAISRFNRPGEGVHISTARRELERLNGEWKERKLDQSKKITLENIRQAIKKGEPMPVKVRRSAGTIEEGWRAMGVDEKTGKIVVKSFQIPGMPMSKEVSLEDLKKWNG